MQIALDLFVQLAQIAAMMSTLTESDLIQARERLGLNHVEAGSRLGVDRSTFQRWERELPTRSTSLIAIKTFIDMAKREAPVGSDTSEAA